MRKSLGREENPRKHVHGKHYQIHQSGDGFDFPSAACHEESDTGKAHASDKGDHDNASDGTLNDHSESKASEDEQ